MSVNGIKFLLLTLMTLTGINMVHAASVRLGNVVPGTVIKKDIQSMRERQYEHLVEQQTDFSCGAAALATILKYAYGADTNEREVLKGMMNVANPEQVRKRGFSLLDLKNYVQAIGLRARGYEIEAKRLDDVSIPTIVLLNIDGYKHFVVLKKASGDRVYIADPALGNKIMERQEFLNSWNNIIFAVIGEGFNRNTVLLKPDQPLTARRLHDVFAPVPKARLLDFGFRHADFF